MKRALAAAGLAAAVVGAAWTSRVTEGRRALAECDAAVKRADHVEAIAAARAAAQARCPLCASSELGYARLYAIAKDAETRGDDATALAAWRAVRAATLGAPVFDVAPARRGRAEAELARLGHRRGASAAAAGETTTAAATEESLRDALGGPTVPGGATFFLLGAGGVLFLVGAARFATSAAQRRADLATAAVGGAVAASALLF